MIALKIAPRPRKRSRARAYSASESKKIRPSVTVIETNVELKNHSGKSCWPSSWKAACTYLLPVAQQVALRGGEHDDDGEQQEGDRGALAPLLVVERGDVREVRGGERRAGLGERA
jgi:hypothetical protein